MNSTTAQRSNSKLSAAQALRAKAAASLQQANVSLAHTKHLRASAQQAKKAAEDIESDVGNSLLLSEDERMSFHQDLLSSIETVCRRHGIDVEFGEMSVSDARGIMHLPVRMVTHAYNAWRKANPYFRERGQTQAEMRFAQFHTEVGLTPTDLHDRFEIDGILYELLGLKGRNHKVILKPLNTPEHTTSIELPANEFRVMIGKQAATA
jgi:hypothetical protein